MSPLHCWEDFAFLPWDYSGAEQGWSFMTGNALMVRPPQLSLAAVLTQILQKVGQPVPFTGRPPSSSRCHGSRGRAHRIAAGTQVPGSTCPSAQLAGDSLAAMKQAC